MNINNLEAAYKRLKPKEYPCVGWIFSYSEHFGIVVAPNKEPTGTTLFNSVNLASPSRNKAVKACLNTVITRTMPHLCPALFLALLNYSPTRQALQTWLTTISKDT